MYDGASDDQEQHEACRRRDRLLPRAPHALRVAASAISADAWSHARERADEPPQPGFRVRLWSGTGSTGSTSTVATA